jgi:hypothetical protein
MFGLTPFNRKKSSLINRPQSIFDVDNIFDSFLAIHCYHHFSTVGK